MAEVCFEKTKPIKKTVVARDLRKVRKNPTLLKTAIEEQNWQYFSDMEDVNDMVKSWTKNIIAALDQVAPKKERVLKNGKRRPNWTPEVLQKIKEKNDLNDKLNRSKTGSMDVALQDAYRKSRNQCNNLLRTEHRKLMGTHLSENSTINEVWKGVNTILAPRQNSKPLTVKVNNDKIDDPN